MNIIVSNAFFDGGLTEAAISRYTGCSIDQVKRLIRNNEFARHPSRRPSFSEEERELIDFISASSTNRRMSCTQLTETLKLFSTRNIVIRYSLDTLASRLSSICCSCTAAVVREKAAAKIAICARSGSLVCRNMGSTTKEP